MNDPIPAPADIPDWFLRLIRYLAACYPNWSPTAATGVAYFDALQDVEQRWVEEATRVLVRESRDFAPSAGTIRERAIRERRERGKHPSDCDCLPCIQALPASERWLRMSPSMRTMLEMREPDTAKQLQSASRALKTETAKQLAAHGVEFSAKTGTGPTALGDVLRGAR